MKYPQSAAILILAAALSCPFPAFSADTVSFTIAPPPLGYPELTKGLSARSVGANMLYIDFKQADLTMAGAMGFMDIQYCPIDRLGIMASGGLSLLAADTSDLMMFSIPLGASVAFEAVRLPFASLYAFAGCGANVSMSFMTVPALPYPYLVWDDTTVTTTTVLATFTGGAQLSLRAASLVLSPYLLWSLSSGSWTSTQTSSMSYSYPSYSGEIPASSTLIVGLDLLHTPSGLTLSSMLQRNDDYTLLSVTLKKRL